MEARVGPDGDIDGVVSSSGRSCHRILSVQLGMRCFGLVSYRTETIPCDESVGVMTKEEDAVEDGVSGADEGKDKAE